MKKQSRRARTIGIKEIADLYTGYMYGSTMKSISGVKGTLELPPLRSRKFFGKLKKVSVRHVGRINKRYPFPVFRITSGKLKGTELIVKGGGYRDMLFNPTSVAYFQDKNWLLLRKLKNAKRFNEYRFRNERDVRRVFRDLGELVGKRTIQGTTHQEMRVDHIIITPSEVQLIDWGLSYEHGTEFQSHEPYNPTRKPSSTLKDYTRKVNVLISSFVPERFQKTAKESFFGAIEKSL